MSRSASGYSPLLLKACIFATGLAGIVAEYVLSTLASYLLGNAVFQWTLIMSFMLFAMGLGSRLSRRFHTNLIDTFILIEFFLSILCAGSSVLVYGLAAYSSYTDLVIYCLSMAIGLLIGCEIPLVTRINKEYEDLRTNIATILEKDYYGALLGGLLFAFVALPHLGLTYTPAVLGSINFLVACAFVVCFFSRIKKKKQALAGAVLCSVSLVGIAVFARPVILYGEQKQYQDTVIYARQTAYQKIVLTQWKKDYWLFINGQEQFSSFDEEKYHEPLVHPAMSLAAETEHVLILGGGDGLALREILRHKGVRQVSMVDLDPAMTELGKTHPVLQRLNEHAMHDARLQIYNQDAAAFLREHDDFYSVIIIDLPDPDTVDLMHLYSVDFYQLVKKRLRPGGVAVTQATSPSFSPLAFLCISKTMQAAGLATVPYHTSIPTMGQWGWVVAMEKTTPQAMRQRLEKLSLQHLPTRFLNRDAMQAMLRFGKGLFDHPEAGTLQVNTRHNPVLMQYYAQGNWAMY